MGDRLTDRKAVILALRIAYDYEQDFKESYGEDCDGARKVHAACDRRCNAFNRAHIRLTGKTIPGAINEATGMDGELIRVEAISYKGLTTLEPKE